MNVSKKVLTPLSVFDDVLFLNLLCLYFYNGELSTVKIKENLEATVKEIPILSSKIVKKDEKLYFEHVSPSNVTFRVKNVPEELYHSYKPDKNGILSVAEGCQFHKYTDNIEHNRSPMKVYLGEAVLKLSLLVTEKTRKSILAVSINHAVADAHSIVYFMQKLSLGSNFKEFEKFEISRLPFMKSKTFNIAESDPKTQELLQAYHPYKKNFHKEDIGISWGTDHIQKIIHFSKERILELKSKVKTKEKFSSNDCIVAHMWKLFSFCTALKPSTVTPCNLIINFRNRVDGITKEYFGNGVFNFAVDLTQQEIKESSYRDLVMKIRNLVNSANTDNFHKVLDCFRKYRFVFTNREYIRKSHIHLDDWRLIDAKKPGNFESGKDVKCERVILHPPSNNYTSYQWYFVNLNDNDGINVKATFTKDVFEKIKHIEDLSDVMALDEIYKIFWK